MSAYNVNGIKLEANKNKEQPLTDWNGFAIHYLTESLKTNVQKRTDNKYQTRKTLNVFPNLRNTAHLPTKIPAS